MKKKRMCDKWKRVKSFRKFFLIMKLACIFILFSMFQLSANVRAQNNLVSLQLDNVTLEEFIDAVKEQTNISFFYNASLFSDVPKVSLHVENVFLKDVLKDVLGEAGFVFDFEDNVVVIQKMKQLLPQQKRRIVKGVVKDSDGLLLPGVTVLIKGTMTGVVTDNNGRYSIAVDCDTATLQFSFMGLQMREEFVGKRLEINVVLLSDTKKIDEVVVTGYQTISKERATGAFGMIPIKTIERKLQSNLASLLEGQAAGVVLDQNGKIEIRGVSTFNAETEPLVVVDGYPIEGGMEMINPEMIENITILKDGVAASIYGSRAANGVIVVTTRSGQRDRFSVSYKGVVSVVLKPEFSDLKRASTSDYIDAEMELFNQNPNRPSTMSQNSMGRVTWLLMQVRENNMTETEAIAEIEKLRKVNGLRQAEKYIMRNQFSHQHNLSVSGGSEKNRFSTGVNYLDHRGDMINTDDWRLIFDIKNDWNPNKYVSFGLLANVVYKRDQRSVRDWKEFVNHTSYDLIQPYDNLVDGNGKAITIFSTSTYKIDNYKLVDGMKDWTYNPIADLSKEMIYTTDMQVRVGGNLRVNITDWLNIETGGMWTRGNVVQKTIYDVDSYRMRIAYNDGTSRSNYSDHYIPDGARIDESRNVNENWTLRNQVNFNRTFGEDRHRVVFLLGNEVRRITYDNNQYATRLGYNSTSGSFVPVNIKDYNSGLYRADMFMAGAFFYLQPGSYSLGDNRFVSWYGNASYEFNDRYLLSGSVRLDLTNFFGTNPKYRYKPLWSIGGTWKLSNEKFFDIEWVNRLYLRGSYGVNGNISLNEGPFLILSGGAYDYVTGGISYGIASAPNDQLRWEKTATTNIGGELALLDNRLDISLDFYKKNSVDLLATDAIDPTTGFSSQTRNVGCMVNKGIELELKAGVVRRGDFSWDMMLNLSYNANKVKTYNVSRPYTSDYTEAPQMVEGYPADGLFGFRYAGLNENGGAMGYSASGEKKSLGNLGVDDVVYLGTTRPKSNVSFTNSFRLGDINFSFMLIARLGHKYIRDGFDGTNYLNRHVVDRWMQPGDEATKMYPRLVSSSMDSWYFAHTDFMTGNASFMKLRDMTLSYALPSKSLNLIGLTSGNIYFQARNLFTITAAGVDIDPESATMLSLRPEFYFGLSFVF